MTQLNYHTANTLEELNSIKFDITSKISKLEEEIEDISEKRENGWSNRLSIKRGEIRSKKELLDRVEKKLELVEKNIEKEMKAFQKAKDKELKAIQKAEEKELREIEKEKQKYEKQKLKETMKNVEKDEDTEKLREIAKEYLEKKIEEHGSKNFAYVAQEGCFYYLRFYPEIRRAEWVAIPTRHDIVGTPISDRTAFNLFVEEMGEAGLRFQKTYNSLQHEFHGQLNLNTFDLQKLQPKEGKPHFLFDVLMTSLSGGDPEGAKHLKQIIGYKWLNPSDFKLPMVTWSGKGGTGKNLFMRALEIIFGNGSMTSTSLSAISQYTDSIMNKMVVFLDECPLSSENTEIIKSISGNPSMPFNSKHGRNGNMEINFLMFASSNNHKGPVLLAGTGPDGEDRRFSPLILENTLKEILDNYLDSNLELLGEETVNNITNTKGNTDFWDSHILNEDNLAVWLNECINEATSLKGKKIKAYHGPSYDKLVSIQADTPIKILLANVFTKPDFEWISIDTLTSLYRKYVENDSARVKKSAIGSANMKHHVEQWLKNNKLADKISILERKQINFKPDLIDGVTIPRHTKARDIVLLNDYNKDPNREGYYLSFEDNSKFYLSGSWEYITETESDLETSTPTESKIYEFKKKPM